jgi:hypothetical protein
MKKIRTHFQPRRLMQMKGQYQAPVPLFMMKEAQLLIR